MSGPEVPSSTAATAIPARATAMPSSRRRPGRSASTTDANSTVNTAWIWSTSEDNPAAIPSCIPMNSSPNFATPRASPTPRIQRQATLGGPTRKTAGSAATRNRRAQKSRGGKWSRPTSMTTKLIPHRAVTSTARAMCTGRMGRGSTARTL